MIRIEEYGRLPHVKFDDSYSFTGDGDQTFLAYRPPELILSWLDHDFFQNPNNIAECEMRKRKCAIFSYAAFCFHLITQGTHVPVVLQDDEATTLGNMLQYYQAYPKIDDEMFKTRCVELEINDNFSEAIVNCLSFSADEREITEFHILYSKLSDNSNRFGDLTEEEIRAIEMSEIHEMDRKQEQEDEIIRRAQRESAMFFQKKEEQDFEIAKQLSLGKKQPESAGKKAFIEYYKPQSADFEQYYQKFMENHQELFQNPEVYVKDHPINVQNLKFFSNKPAEIDVKSKFGQSNPPGMHIPSAPPHPSLFNQNLQNNNFVPPNQNSMFPQNYF